MKEGLLIGLKSLAFFIYLVLLVVVCAAVWSAANGNETSTFSVVCAVIHFFFDGAILGYTFRGFLKSLRK